VFVGSVQTAHGPRNEVNPEVQLASIDQFKAVLSKCMDSQYLLERLDPTNGFENSRWEFAGTISLALLLNARLRVPPQYQQLTKIFYAAP